MMVTARWRWIAACVAAAFVLMAVGLAGCGHHAPSGVTEETNVAYHQGSGADQAYHYLDLYLPSGASDYPVVVFVHGGEWEGGDKSDGKTFGETLAQNGIGVASINYGLAPAVENPEQARDVARALAWVKANLPGRGADQNHIFLCGYSAGGQLVSLIASNSPYLNEQGLKLSDIKGVICLSGVYNMVSIGQYLGFALQPIFGTDPNAFAQASPQLLISPQAPPFLILYAQSDLASLPEQARAYAQALQQAGVKVTIQQIAGRDHTTMQSLLGTKGDPATADLLDFLSGLTH